MIKNPQILKFLSIYWKSYLWRALYWVKGWYNTWKERDGILKNAFQKTSVQCADEWIENLNWILIKLPRERGKRGRVMMETRNFSPKIPNICFDAIYMMKAVGEISCDTTSKDVKVFKALEVSKIPPNIQSMLTSLGKYGTPALNLSKISF